MKLFSIILITLLPIFLVAQSLKPYEENRAYWQYQGEPVLLLGASNNDNLFQSDDFEEQLEKLKSIGGNYIRCTLSSRDEGDIQPHKRMPSGKYDLNFLSAEYKDRFERLLSKSSELDIIIQIEIWDRFDYTRDSWEKSSFNPINNINYSHAENGLAEHYPDHPSRDKQPFFHTIKGMPLYHPNLESLLKFQKKFIDMILDITLQYDNVLYCMNNETSTPKEWGRFWIAFIKKRAESANKYVYLTDMFDEFFKPQYCEVCQQAIIEKDIYTFLDVSQINSRNFGQAHWDTLQFIMSKVQNYKRPINCTKIYGGGNTGWGSGSLDDGVERFFRNIFGGIAAARFHRPPTGNGLNERSMAAIRSVRILENYARFWDMETANELLLDREADEAYCVKKKNNSIIFIYFPYWGEIILNLSEIPLPDEVEMNWLDVTYGKIYQSVRIKAEKSLTIKTPLKKGSVAIVTF